VSYLKFRDGFISAMNPDFHRIEELDAKVADGSALMWSTDKSAVIGEVQRFPNALALHCLCATGDMDEIVTILAPQAEDWARQAGCTHVIVESREGWARVLRKHGYGAHQITLAKVL
jgi:N-acyl-L-homoserine lactone synthetase